MNKIEKTAKITKVVIKSIWWILGIALWIVGLTGIFLDNTMDSKFLSWMIWGIMCTPFIIGFIVKNAKKGAEDSARDGARHYTYDSSTGTISNHPFAGYVFGFLAGIFVGVLFGPIALPLFFVKNVVDIVETIIEIKRAA
ncbi:MAG: hypothetical protein E7617_05705 [Ruminococcaceae bacterium]|nr:hypothetical protein [Oscillospiraceae bacterium]